MNITVKNSSGNIRPAHSVPADNGSATTVIPPTRQPRITVNTSGARLSQR